MKPVLKQFAEHLSTAYRYGGDSLWEFAHKELDEAYALISERELSSEESRNCTLRYLHRRGALERRQGDSAQAIKTLEYAIEIFATKDLEHARMLGELGTAYQRQDAVEQAAEIFRRQYELATHLVTAAVRSARHIWRAEALAARAIGYQGIMIYLMSVSGIEILGNVDRKEVEKAIEMCTERVSRTRKLLHDISSQDIAFQEEIKTVTCICVALDRLSLFCGAIGQTSKAVEWARQSVAEGRAFNPGIQGWGRFFLGLALQRDGHPEEAASCWTSHGETNKCTPAIALSQEPCGENVGFMAQLVKYRVPMDHYDEQGYSALDYAVMGSSDTMTAVVMRGLRQGYLDRGHGADQADDLANMRKTEAIRRKEYRSIFQRTLRPYLRANAAIEGVGDSPNEGASTRAQACISLLRKQYFDLLEASQSASSIFDYFKYITMCDFESLARLPSPNEADAMTRIASLARPYEASGNGDKLWDHPYVVFLSYRWLGHGTPDDQEGTQLRRMKLALLQFLEAHPWLGREEIGVWLDIGCVDQRNPIIKQRGINALPLIIAQSNAIISLDDPSYHSRAWCSVEVLMMQTLRDSYGLHESWYQRFPSLRFERALTRPPVDDDLTGLQMTFPDKDEPTVKFLVRQSRILGRL